MPRTPANWRETALCLRKIAVDIAAHDPHAGLQAHQLARAIERNADRWSDAPVDKVARLAVAEQLG